MPPTTPVNHYLRSRDQQHRTEVSEDPLYSAEEATGGYEEGRAFELGRQDSEGNHWSNTTCLTYYILHITYYILHITYYIILYYIIAYIF